MFSDNYRYIKISLLLSALLLLCSYSQLKGLSMYVNLETRLSAPEQFDGQEVILEDYVTVTSVFKDRFEIEQEGRKIMVMGTAAGLAPGDEIEIRAIFHRQGYLTLEQLHIKKLRSVKIIISIAAALFVFMLFFSRYRFSLDGFQFAERTRCRT
jgi:hypothetical protein